jgi:cysteine synthase
MSFAGNTPLVSLRFADTKKGSPEILAKLEYRNPTGSIKDRVAEWYLKGKSYIICRMV